MRSDRRTIRSANAAGLASTASAMVALVALAALMTSLPGANVRAAMLESRVAPAEAPSVRAVAAAVAAAARELVGGERITAAMQANHFSDSIAAANPIQSNGSEAADIPLSRPIAERLIDLPPPVC